MNDEEWRPIAGLEHYEVSDQGRVRSLDRVVQYVHRGVDRQRWFPGKLLTCTPWGDTEYLCVMLPRPFRARRVHRLVLEAFVGPRPADAQGVRHLNGQPSDNRLVNLAWGTATENNRDTVLHGHNQNRNKTHCAKRHLFDEANTYTTPLGHRGCRRCRNEHAKASKARKSRLAAAS